MEYLTNWSYESLTLSISLYMMQGRHIMISSHQLKKLLSKLTMHGSWSPIVVEGKPCKCTTSLKNLYIKLAVSLYSLKGINCTIFENQSITTKIKKNPSKQGKPMFRWNQGTACISIATVCLLVFSYLPLSTKILHISWCMLPLFHTSAASKTFRLTTEESLSRPNGRDSHGKGSVSDLSG